MDVIEVKPCLQCRVCGSKEAHSEKGWTATTFGLAASGRSVNEFLEQHLTVKSAVPELMICAVCLGLVCDSDHLFVRFEESLNRIRVRNPETMSSLYVSKRGAITDEPEPEPSTAAREANLEAKTERENSYDEDAGGFLESHYPGFVPEVVLHEKSDDDDDDEFEDEVEDNGEDSDYEPGGETRRKQPQRRSTRRITRVVRSSPKKVSTPQDGTPKRRGRPPKIQSQQTAETSGENGQATDGDQSGTDGGNAEGAPIARRTRRSGTRRSYKKSTTFMATDDGETPAVVCKTCGKTYPYKDEEDKKQYAQHRRAHAMERRKERNVCSLCQFKARSASELISHVAVVHEKQKPFVCNYCGKAFSTPATKSVHEKRVHADIIGFKLIICDCCGKGFTSASALKAHRGEYKYDYSGICDVCGEYVKNVKVHVSLKHKGPPSCRVCGKVCKNFWAKRFHESKEHGIGKPKTRTKYKCDECGREFWARFNLVRHLAQKHGRRPAPEDIFTCPHCNKEFYCKVTWKEHVNGHLGITPYSCPACGYATNIESNLHLHVRQVHKSRLSQVKAAIRAAEAAAQQAAAAANAAVGGDAPELGEPSSAPNFPNMVSPEDSMIADQRSPVLGMPQAEAMKLDHSMDSMDRSIDSMEQRSVESNHSMEPQMPRMDQLDHIARMEHFQRMELERMQHMHEQMQRAEHMQRVDHMQRMPMPHMDTDDSSSIPEAMASQ